MAAFVYMCATSCTDDAVAVAVPGLGASAAVASEPARRTRRGTEASPPAGATGLCVTGMFRTLGTLATVHVERIVRPWLAEVFLAVEVDGAREKEEMLALSLVARTMAAQHVTVYRPGGEKEADVRNTSRPGHLTWCRLTPRCTMRPVPQVRVGWPINSSLCGWRLKHSPTFVLQTLRKQQCLHDIEEHERTRRETRYEFVGFVRSDLWLARPWPAPWMGLGRGVAERGVCAVHVNGCMGAHDVSGSAARTGDGHPGTTAVACRTASDWAALVPRRCVSVFVAAVDVFLVAAPGCRDVFRSTCHRSDELGQECLLSGYLRLHQTNLFALPPIPVGIARHSIETRRSLLVDGINIGGRAIGESDQANARFGCTPPDNRTAVGHTSLWQTGMTGRHARIEKRLSPRDLWECPAELSAKESALHSRPGRLIWTKFVELSQRLCQRQRGYTKSKKKKVPGRRIRERVSDFFFFFKKKKAQGANRFSFLRKRGRDLWEPGRG